MAGRSGGPAARRGTIDAVRSLRGLEPASLSGIEDRSAYVGRGYSHEAAFYRHAVRRAGFDREERVLDLGCGFGRWTAFLAEVNPAVVGIDPLPKRLDMARRLMALLGFDNARFETATADALPFGDDSFESVWSFSAFHFCPRAASFAELRRVLVPGGRFFAGYYFGLGRVVDLLCRAYRRGGWDDPDAAMAWQALAKGLESDAPLHYATSESVREIFAAHGFAAEDVFVSDPRPAPVADPLAEEIASDPAAAAQRFRDDAAYRNLMLENFSRIAGNLDDKLNVVARAV